MSFLPPKPLATTSVFFMSGSLFLFCRKGHLCHILDSTCKCVCGGWGLSRFSCVWLSNSMDCNLPGSSVRGITVSRQEHWSGLPPCPPPGDLPDSGIKLTSPAAHWAPGEHPMPPTPHKWYVLFVFLFLTHQVHACCCRWFTLEVRAPGVQFKERDQCFSN